MPANPASAVPGKDAQGRSVSPSKSKDVPAVLKPNATPQEIREFNLAQLAARTKKMESSSTSSAAATASKGETTAMFGGSRRGPDMEAMKAANKAFREARGSNDAPTVDRGVMSASKQLGDEKLPQKKALPSARLPEPAPLSEPAPRPAAALTPQEIRDQNLARIAARQAEKKPVGNDEEMKKKYQEILKRQESEKAKAEIDDLKSRSPLRKEDFKDI